jgi:hypothetical protein
LLVDASACEAVDGAVFDHFASVGLDVEATRRQLLEAAERQLRDARTLREDAETQAHAAAEAVQRISRDYARGALSAESFEELKPQLVAELEAAEAKADRLREREERLLANPERCDLEEELLAELARIRAALAGEVDDVQGGPYRPRRPPFLCLFEAFSSTPTCSRPRPRTRRDSSFTASVATTCRRQACSPC